MDEEFLNGDDDINPMDLESYQKEESCQNDCTDLE